MDEPKVTLQDLETRYNAMKADANNKADILQKALNTINSLFPQVQNDNANAWNALKDKGIIKQFYNDYVTADYAKEKNITQDDAKPHVEKALHDFLNTIKGNPNEGGTRAFNNYLREISDHDITNDFQCGILPANSKMHAINFPKATLSFIAGRPSAGKTTALASVAMYAMRNTKKNVLFVTSEETPQQLITRFIKNQFCDNCIKDNKGAMLLHDYGKSYINDTFKDIIKKAYAEKQGSLFAAEPKDDFIKQVLKAAKDVENFIEGGRLQLFNLDKTTSFEELKDALQELERHTIVIVDYIQNLPYGPKTENGGTITDRLESLRQQIFAINTIIKANELIGIAGAQFNREGASEREPEGLELKNLGDSGEIERKAHIVIGLGRKINDDNKKQYFYRVMKDREGDISTHFEIADYYAYSYLQAKQDANGELIPFPIGYKNGGNSKRSNKKDDKGKEPATNNGNVIDRKNDTPITI